MPSKLGLEAGGKQFEDEPLLLQVAAQPFYKFLKTRIFMFFQKKAV